MEKHVYFLVLCLIQTGALAGEIAQLGPSVEESDLPSAIREAFKSSASFDTLARSNNKAKMMVQTVSGGLRPVMTLPEEDLAALETSPLGISQPIQFSPACQMWPSSMYIF